ncbi:hypothetical protein LUZ61_005987 [Rhynchospora tenuis]|uniref:RNA-dependent RNA polymerase n=1 Tax=Rhynchospora tenuis TaxID=198213 RepID=A0AAD6EV34_9POAL|nr:hypothetical protein LUZ61_005987 [Rhynchospora tenuis]
MRDQPKKVLLSRFLISLLHYGGVPSEFFLGLLSSALEEIETCVTDRNVAIKVVKNHSELDDYDLLLTMLDAGVPLCEPYLQYRLKDIITEKYKVLQEGKIPISNTYFLRGTADPTGTLSLNQVCVVSDEGQLSGDVLLYKYPGLHSSDIYKLQAVCLPEWEEIVGDSKYGIFFSTAGPCSLVDKMVNNNSGGDVYWVSQNPELLKKFTPSLPRLAPEENMSKKDSEQHIPSNMKKDEVESCEPSYAIGTAADCWLACMDHVLTCNLLGEEARNIMETKMEQLVNIYDDALDAAKTVKKVQVPNCLLVDLYPHFMDQKPKEKTYHSTSILGEIYDKVESFKSKMQKLQLIKMPLPSYRVVQKSCMDKWGYHFDQYLTEMSQVVGSVSDKNVSDINKTYQEVIDKYKEILYGGVKEFKRSTRLNFEIYDEACAIYKLDYDKTCEMRMAGYCWFAWHVAGEALCELCQLSRLGFII